MKVISFTFFKLPSNFSFELFFVFNLSQATTENRVKTGQSGVLTLWIIFFICLFTLQIGNARKDTFSVAVYLMAEQKCLSVVGLRSQTIVVKFLYMLITKDQIYAIVAHVLLILTGKYLNSLILPLTAECKHIFSAVTRASLRASAVKLCCFQV